METKFTEQESLALIGEMIKQARNNFQKGSGNSMIFYGIWVSVLSVLNIILALVFMKLNVNPSYSFWVWCLMIPSFYGGYLIEKKIEREAIVKTHLDSILSSTWKAFTYSVFIFLALAFSFGFGKNFYHIFYIILPVILLLMGMGEFVCAKIYRFKPYLYGAVIMWAGVLACVAVMWTPHPVFFQLAINAICLIFGFVIPGLKINKSAKENV